MNNYKSEITLNEKDSLQDMLNVEKAMVKLYSTALTEGCSKGFRTLVKENFSSTIEDQFKVFAMMTEQGFATTNQTFYQSDGIENGRVEYEFYYDDKGQPISLSLGQYGIHKAYNQDGLEDEIIYLDMKGNPIITNKGYTKIHRTYRKNDIVVTVQYYDINGDPFQISEGQYGTIYQNDQVAYLDRDGNRIFSIRNLLHDQPWVIILFTVSIVVLSSFARNILHYVILAVNVTIIVYHLF